MSGKQVPAFVENGHDTICKFSSGSIWKTPEVEVSFSFTNFDYPLSHIHSDFCEILLIHSGRILNCVDDHSFIMNAGDCCIIHKDNKHRCHFIDDDNSGYVAINFAIRFDAYEKLKHSFGSSLVYMLEHSDEPKLFHISDAMRRTIYSDVLSMQTPMNEYFFHNELACRKLILDLLYSYIRHRLDSRDSKLPDWIRDLLERVQKTENLSKKPSELIGTVNYSYSYIAREFKRYMGCSFVKYFNAVKLNCAREMLIHTDQTIISIASQLGFNSLTHFINLFKEAFGVPPSSLRKSG